ncbi:AAA family ATPase [Streptomyces sp. ODS28]|uniref:AAA family ATPase n=1 Tax=Streptomyces sp. ODS28 TaxID=3136688 RepID=UPI0031F193D7
MHGAGNPRPVALVGREQALSEVGDLLLAERLVTVTGPGGVGKTALGTELVRRTVPGRWPAATRIDLAHLTDADALPRHLHRALRRLGSSGGGRAAGDSVAGDRADDDRAPGARPAEARADASRADGTPAAGAQPEGAGEVLPDGAGARGAPGGLGSGPALLVVDTCEYLAEPCAKALPRLLDAHPGLRILATSRRAVTGSAHYRLGPLSAEDAIRLFQTGARRWGAPRPATLRTARQICVFLDGLPLAVHIAAGQLVRHSPAEVLDRVSRMESARCAAAGGGEGHGEVPSLLDLTVPGLPERQRTLRDCLLATFRLCSGGERLLWARCTVFPGSFDFKDAVQVCADERLPADVLAVAFGGLEQQALIVPGDPGGVLYAMPWIPRAYGRRHLRELGEEREFLRRCLTWSLPER